MPHLLLVVELGLDLLYVRPLEAVLLDAGDLPLEKKGVTAGAFQGLGGRGRVRVCAHGHSHPQERDPMFGGQTSAGT